jgi:NAD/NADP transhydrogenase alpha subunit
VIAIMFGTINIVGGFLVTDRMLEMFKSRPKPPRELEGKHEAEGERESAAPARAASSDGRRGSQ